MSNSASVSVIVPVKNAAVTLDACIRALLAQDYAGEYEIIMIDNGSHDGSRDILASWQGSIRHSSVATPGASAARNAGIRLARHPWLAFTDADCIPDQGWLSALMAYIENGASSDFIGGRVRAHCPSTDVEIFMDQLYDQQQAIEGFRFPYAISANLCVSRSFFEKLGLFDEACLRGQDVELSYRGLFRHQASFVYLDHAVVAHVHSRTIRGLWCKAVQHGEAAAWVLARYADDIGERPWRRCWDWRRYRDIARLARYAFLEWMQVRSTGERQFSRQYLFELLVASGKQLGFIRRTILIIVGNAWTACRGYGAGVWSLTFSPPESPRV